MVYYNLTIRAKLSRIDFYKRPVSTQRDEQWGTLDV